jgi:tuftelin-interacting protein 11
LRDIQDNYQEEYRLYDLSALTLAVVHPLVIHFPCFAFPILFKKNLFNFQMKKEFENWDAIKDPQYGLSTVKKWRSLLGVMDNIYQQDPDDMEPYDRILWEVWMPRIRLAASRWTVREPDGMTSVLEAWRPILPQWILQSVLEQLIFPRLQDEVDAWNPLTDTVPIHSWLHPWLPLMGNFPLESVSYLTIFLCLGAMLEPLYGPIRHKLSNALMNWYPSDTSAKMILQPWLNVFSQAHMDGFLVKNILPKLSLCMLEFVINPQQQILGKI